MKKKCFPVVLLSLPEIHLGAGHLTVPAPPHRAREVPAGRGVQLLVGDSWPQACESPWGRGRLLGGLALPLPGHCRRKAATLLLILQPFSFSTPFSTTEPLVQFYKELAWPMALPGRSDEVGER